jgi:hypothetical protein
VFENRVLRGIFGPKSEDVMKSWRQMDNSFLTCILTKYYLGDQIEGEMGGACSMHGSDEKCIQ